MMESKISIASRRSSFAEKSFTWLLNTNSIMLIDKNKNRGCFGGLIAFLST